MKIDGPEGELFLGGKWRECSDIKRCVQDEFSGWHVCDSAWRLHKESSTGAGQGSHAAREATVKDFSDLHEGAQLEHEEKGRKSRNH
ncbi:uncharacterized [Tachysurus ichikawai]